MRFFLTSYNLDHCVSGYWFSYISLKHYFRYKDKKIEPWIKKRYLLSGIVALAYVNFGLPSFLNLIGAFMGSFNVTLHIISINLKSIFLGVFSVGYLFAWLIPTKLKNFFDRKFIILEDKDLTEEDIKREIERRD